MRKFKRILAMFLSVIMIISSANIVFAADEPTVTLSSAEGKVGSTVDITVSVSNNPGIISVSLDVEYDPAILKLTKVTDAGAIPGAMHTSVLESPYRLTWENDTAPSNFYANGVYATLTFEVLSDEQTETTLKLSTPQDGILNFDADEVAFNFVNGKVTVTHDHTDADGKWESDENNHWHTCECGTEFDKAAHTGGEATCTKKALCEVCGQEYGVVNSENHKNTEKHEAVEPTCDQAGNIEYWQCLDCGKYFSDAECTDEIELEDTVIPAAHKLVYTPAKEAACEEDGNNEYWKCSVCGKYFSDEEGKTEIKAEDTVIPAAHKLVYTPAKEATCEEDGNNEYWKCSVCGKYFSDEEGKTEIKAEDTVIPAAHELVHHAKVEETCDKDGSIEYWQCSVCGKYFSDEEGKTEIKAEDIVIPAAHKLVHTPAKAATCEEDGNNEYWKCSVCGKYFSDEEGKTEIKAEDTVIPAAHTLVNTPAKAANCHAEGNIEHYHCSVCGKNFSDAEGKTELENVTTPIDPENHDGETELRGKKDATCTEEGYTGDTYCLGCNTKIADGEAIEKLPHTLTKTEAKAATCHAEGNIEYWTCSVCSKNYSDEAGTTEVTEVTTPIDPENHDGETEVRDAKPATCTEEGYTGDTYCLGCNTKIAEGTAIEKLPHTLTKTDAKAANCHETGNIEYWHCSVCDKYFSDEECKTEVAKDELTTPVDPENHDGETEVKHAKKETCGEDGYTGDTYCKGCGKKIATGTKIPATGKHTSSGWIIDEEPTRNSVGIKHKECTVCGLILETAMIPALGGSGSNNNYLTMLGLMNRKFTITAEAGEGGSISNEGKTSVKYNTSLTYFITPDDGYQIKAVYVNNQYVGEIDEYTFKNVKSNQKIKATFEKIPASEAAISDKNTATEPAVTEKTTWNNPFIDVADNAAYIDAIQFVYENQLFKGVSDNEFAPDTTMTRAMFVTVLGRMSGVNTENYTETSFTDVVAGEWYAPYVEWAAQNGIVLGYGDGNFGVNNKITVEQAAVILARYAEYTKAYVASEATLNEYTDAEKVSEWALDSVKWASENGIYTGTDGELVPQNPASRALIATMIYNYATTFDADVK